MVLPKNVIQKQLYRENIRFLIFVQNCQVLPTAEEFWFLTMAPAQYCVTALYCDRNLNVPHISPQNVRLQIFHSARDEEQIL